MITHNPFQNAKGKHSADLAHSQRFFTCNINTVVGIGVLIVDYEVSCSTGSVSV